MCLKTTFLKGVIYQVNDLRQGKTSPQQFKEHTVQTSVKLTEELQQSALLGKDVSFLIQGSMNLQKSDPSLPITSAKLVKKFSTQIIKSVVHFTETKLRNPKEVISNKQKKEIAKAIQLVLPDANKEIKEQLVKLDDSLKIERNLKELKKWLTAKDGRAHPCILGGESMPHLHPTLPVMEQVVG